MKDNEKLIRIEINYAIDRIINGLVHPHIEREKLAKKIEGIYSSTIFKVGDKVQFRDMHLTVVEIGANKVLVATTENVNAEDYNDWWADTKHVKHI